MKPQGPGPRVCCQHLLSASSRSHSAGGFSSVSVDFARPPGPISTVPSLCGRLLLCPHQWSLSPQEFSTLVRLRTASVPWLTHSWAWVERSDVGGGWTGDGKPRRREYVRGSSGKAAARTQRRYRYPSSPCFLLGLHKRPPPPRPNTMATASPKRVSHLFLLFSRWCTASADSLEDYIPSIV